MLKTVTREVVKFIPSKEQAGLDKHKDYKATAVYFLPMSKRDYDVYIASLTEFRRTKLVNKSNQSSRLLFDKCLTAGPEGQFLENVEIEGKFVPSVNDRTLAVNFLLDMGDLETATEIELAMKGMSSLDEEDEKN